MLESSFKEKLCYGIILVFYLIFPDMINRKPVRKEGKAMPRRLKLILLAAVFIGGFASLSLELIVLRQLSSFVGATAVTASIVIGVIMAFMSLGYYAGSVFCLARGAVRQTAVASFYSLSILTVLAASYILIDLRSEKSFSCGHIPESINISESQLIAQVDALSEQWRDRKLILICEYGELSYFYARILQDKGYYGFSLSGGFIKWSELNYPRSSLTCPIRR